MVCLHLGGELVADAQDSERVIQGHEVGGLIRPRTGFNFRETQQVPVQGSMVAAERFGFARSDDNEHALNNNRVYLLSMITRMSTLFLRTLREDLADAEVPSHKLLVRAGYIRRVSPACVLVAAAGLESSAQH